MGVRGGDYPSPREDGVLRQAFLLPPGTVHQVDGEATPACLSLSSPSTFPGWLLVQKGQMARVLARVLVSHRKLHEQVKTCGFQVWTFLFNIQLSCTQPQQWSEGVLCWASGFQPAAASEQASWVGFIVVPSCVSGSQDALCRRQFLLPPNTH